MMLKFKPDLVFLDILMPKLSGVEALKQLQNYPELKNIPIIICSAESNIKTVEKALTLGAVDYIVKPFTMEIVLKKAEKWLFPEDSSRNRS
jgi:CheY-like chemotaxis protein